MAIILRLDRVMADRKMSLNELSERVGVANVNLSKLKNGIYDTPVTLAAKSHLRNRKPLIIGVSTNDALSVTAKNIGELMNYKHHYFIPLKQDNPHSKPSSIVCDFDRLSDTIEAALKGEQYQPILS